MAKAIRNVFHNDKFLLSEATDGYYVYDYVLKFNIVMRAKTEQDACIEALLYYQKRLAQVRAEYKTLDDKVQNFIGQFDRDDF